MAVPARNVPAPVRPFPRVPALNLVGLLTLTLAAPVAAQEEPDAPEFEEADAFELEETDDSELPEAADECQDCDRCCCCDEPCVSAGRAKADESGKRVSLTFSPLHLLYPVFELAAEVRAAPHLGLGIIVGTGRMTTETTDSVTGQEETIAAVAQEWGGFAAFYPFKPFRGFQLGTELLYMRVDADELNGDVAEVANGLAIGPFLGYKLMAKVGFTGEVQVGGQYVTARSETRNSAGAVVEKAGAEWAPLVNFNIGWSF